MSRKQKLHEFGRALQEAFDPDGDFSDIGITLVETEFYDTTRWSEFHRYYYVDEVGNYYRLTAEYPATEMQEGMDCNNTLEIVEAKAVMKTEYVEVHDCISIDWERPS